MGEQGADTRKPYQVAHWAASVSIDKNGKMIAVWQASQYSTNDAHILCDLLNDLTERAESAERRCRRDREPGPGPEDTRDPATLRIKLLASIDVAGVAERAAEHLTCRLTTDGFIRKVAHLYYADGGDQNPLMLTPVEAAALLGGCDRVVRLSDGSWYLLPGGARRMAERVEVPRERGESTP